MYILFLTDARTVIYETLGKMIELIRTIHSKVPQASLYLVMTVQENWMDMAIYGHVTDKWILELLGEKPDEANANITLRRSISEQESNDFFRRNQPKLILQILQLQYK